MKKFLKQNLVFLLIFLLSASMLLPTFVFAETENKCYLGETVNAGKDTGYTQKNEINKKDPHFGWKIGEFFVSGYSAKDEDAEGNPVFLKNVGDQVTLWFCLNENIDKLNNNEKLSVCEDTNGYDEYFGIKKTNFGKGALIVRHKDSENHWGEPTIYTDYLAAKTSKGAYTQVDIFEEGDYEVALNYEIKETGFNIFGWKPLPTYYNYRIFFKFSVRNGNCMVYPFDVETKAELTNAAFTENGFYLDLAQSKYLDVIVQREVFKESSEGLVSDVRFNKPAKDGERYTEEGLYTITVSNKYTKEETVKKIYVGTNDVLKAHVTTGFTIEEIKHQISLGATVGEDGQLIPAANQVPPESDTPVNTEPTPVQEQSPDYKLYAVVGGAVLLLVALIIAIVVIKKTKNKNTSENEEGKEE